MGRDITERIRAQAELQQYRDGLERLVEQRTRDLREANRALQSANEAKRSFMASMSHELRTPLNAVLGYAQLLKMGSGLSERQVAGLTIIEQGGQHLLALITDILDLARVEAGKLALLPKPFDLPAFLGVVVDIIRVRAQEKSLCFRYEPAAPLPNTVVADEQRLRQILLNLLGNAVKFTDAGEVTLRVQAHPHAVGTRLCIDVLDTGVGIAAEDQGRLFRPFEQVSEARRRVSGAGLGLSISQALAQLMGSRISVQSTLGQGSCFSFELTLPTPEAAITVPPPTRHRTGYAGPRKRLLIADDVVANRMMLTDLLQTLGFDTVHARDGREALAVAQRERPDLILMDVVMPVMGGLEAMRQLRATPSFASVPIIAVSASVTQEHGQECLAAGASAYLPKPIDAAQLLASIGVLLALQWQYEDPA
jgi:signal transduction histidine kinase/CheY-like chemotaxis protein